MSCKRKSKKNQKLNVSFKKLEDVLYLDLEELDNNILKEINLKIKNPLKAAGYSYSLNFKNTNLKLGILEKDIICYTGITSYVFQDLKAKKGSKDVQNSYPKYSFCMPFFTNDGDDEKFNLIVENLKKIDKRIKDLFLENENTAHLFEKNDDCLKSILSFYKIKNDDNLMSNKKNIVQFDYTKPCINIQLYMDSEKYDELKSKFDNGKSVSKDEFDSLASKLFSGDIRNVNECVNDDLEKLNVIDSDFNSILKKFLIKSIVFFVNGWISDTSISKHVSTRCTLNSMAIDIRDPRQSSLAYKIKKIKYEDVESGDGDEESVDEEKIENQINEEKL